jgi:hypothetical protein
MLPRSGYPCIGPLDSRNGPFFAFQGAWKQRTAMISTAVARVSSHFQDPTADIAAATDAMDFSE